MAGPAGGGTDGGAPGADAGAPATDALACAAAADRSADEARPLNTLRKGAA